MSKTIYGYVKVGVKNPVYNKEVELEVLDENMGYNGNGTWVRTIQKYPVNHCLIDIRTSKTTKEWVENQYIEGWLEK